MDNIFDFALLAFTSIFTMVNPLGILPVYTGLTAKLPAKEAKQVAIKAIITAIVTLILFAMLGRFIFEFFQISVNSLRIVGGVVFFMAGYDMLQARLIRTKSSEESVTEFASDIAITPLAIPMICGPGAITVSMILMNDAQEMTHKFVLVGVIIFIMLITLIFLLSARKIIKALGDNGNKVLMRIMGLIVMVIAVEFFLGGIKNYILELNNSL